MYKHGFSCVPRDFLPCCVFIHLGGYLACFRFVFYLVYFCLLDYLGMCLNPTLLNLLKNDSRVCEYTHVCSRTCAWVEARGGCLLSCSSTSACSFSLTATRSKAGSQQAPKCPRVCPHRAGWQSLCAQGLGQLFLWALLTRTWVFTRVRKLFLPTEPSPQTPNLFLMFR